MSTDWILKQFGKSGKPPQVQYKRFVLKGMNEGRREDFHRGTREGSLLGDEEFQNSLDVPTTALSPALFTFADLSEIAHWVYRFYGQPVVRLQEKRRSREMTKLRGRVALFYTEKARLLQEVA